MKRVLWNKISKGLNKQQPRLLIIKKFPIGIKVLMTLNAPINKGIWNGRQVLKPKKY
jgi:hypothetical protein